MDQRFFPQTNKLIHTIRGIDAPHSMVYRADLKRLFVVDGDASEIKVYDTNTYGLVGHVGLYIDADSQAYDPETKLMYVVSGGREAHTLYSYISIVDTTQFLNVDREAAEHGARLGRQRGNRVEHEFMWIPIR